MRTADYSDILQGSAALAGFTMDFLGNQEFQLFRTFHDRRLQAAWEIHRWPELCPIEQRTFRPLYDETGATTYATGDEILDVETQAYFQSLVDDNLNNPPTIAGQENSAFWAGCRTSYSADAFDPTAVYAIGTQAQYLVDANFYQRIVFTGTPDGAWIPANWGLLKVFERSVAYEQPGETAIGEFLTAYDKDPRITTKLVELPFELDTVGAQFVQLRNTFNYGWNPASTNFSYVWLLYRIRRPLLTGDVLDLTTVQPLGRQVYYKADSGKGNFYTALVDTAAGETPDTDPDKWDLVEIPYIFRGYLIEAGYADWLTSADRGDESPKREALAVSLLELEADKLQRQQKQVRRFSMRR